MRHATRAHDADRFPGVGTAASSGDRPAGLALVLCLALAAGCGDAHSAPGPGGPSAAAVVTIGDGVDSIGMFNGGDETPFFLALDSLPRGGTIHVGPGLYRFQQPIVIGAAGTTIRGSGSVLEACSDPAVGIFSIDADSAHLSGLELRDDQPSSAHALLRVTGSDFHLSGCTFLGGPSSMASTFVRLEGPAQGRWIEDCRFVSSGRWTAVRAQDGAGLHFTGNEISGSAQDPVHLEYGLYALDESRGIVSDNVFQHIGDDGSPIHALLYSENSLDEQHHWIIANNLVHDVRSERILDLRGSQFNLITGNTIGRTSSHEAVIDVSPNGAGNGPFATTITANEFHNPGPTPAVRINGGNGHSVQANHFTLLTASAVAVGTTLPASRTTISANQFVSVKSLGTEPAISIQGGMRHAVLSNTFYDFVGPAVEVTGVPDDGYSVESNFER